MPQSRAACAPVMPDGTAFQMDIDTDTGVVVIVPASYLREHGIAYTPGRHPRVREVRLAPGRYRCRVSRDGRRHAYIEPVIEVGNDGLVLVGCPAQIAADGGTEAYNRWLLDTDFLRHGDGSAFVVIEATPWIRRVDCLVVSFAYDMD